MNLVAYIPARVLPIILVSSYISTFMYLMFVNVCTVTEFWILRAALNFGPFKTISVTTYTVASFLSIWRG